MVIPRDVGLLLLQGPLSVLGTDIEVRGWWWQAPLRIPIDFINWLRLLASHEVSPEQDAADRATYAELLAEGTEAFFEPEATHCPM